MRNDIKIKQWIIMLVFFLPVGFLRGQEKDINKLFEEEIQKETKYSTTESKDFTGRTSQFQFQSFNRNVYVDIMGAVDIVGEWDKNTPHNTRNETYVRSTEFGLFGAIDHLATGTILFAAHNEDGVFTTELHEGYFLFPATLIPRTNIRLGQMFPDVGRLNVIHQHDWPFTTPPLVHKELLGEEALLDTGIEFRYLFPWSFWQELSIGIFSGKGFGHSHGGHSHGGHSHGSSDINPFSDLDQLLEEVILHENQPIQNITFDSILHYLEETQKCKNILNLSPTEKIDCLVEKYVEDQMDAMEAQNAQKTKQNPLLTAHLKHFIPLSDYWGTEFGFSYLRWHPEISPKKWNNQYGFDFYLKYKRGKLKSFVWQTEVWYRETKERPTNRLAYFFDENSNLKTTLQEYNDQFDPPKKIEVVETKAGFYSFLNYQLSEQWFIGYRYDYLTIPTFKKINYFTLIPEYKKNGMMQDNIILTYKPSEFSYFRGQVSTTVDIEKNKRTWEYYLQAVFILGVHPAHKY
jgi:hypothetical protein